MATCMRCGRRVVTPAVTVTNYRGDALYFHPYCAEAEGQALLAAVGESARRMQIRMEENDAAAKQGRADPDAAGGVLDATGAGGSAARQRGIDPQRLRRPHADGG